MTEFVLITRPRHSSTTYHIPEEGRPKCNADMTGKWKQLKKSELPEVYTDKCSKCFETADYHDRDYSLFKRAKDGSPEDFGLPEYDNSWSQYDSIN